MVNRIWLLSLSLVTVVMFACGDNPSVGLTTSEESPPWEEYWGSATIEEVILDSDTVARVELLDSSTGTERIGDDQGHVWAANLEFRFRVLEYLKGSGPNEIRAHVSEYYSTQAEAQAGLAAVVAAHDTRWDNRQAVVFLHSEGGPGRYALGVVGGYLLSSIYEKRWLPAESTTTAAGGDGRSVTEPIFLLDVPSDSSTGDSGRRSTSPAVPGTSATITLSAMKKLITDAEALASTGGTADYRKCVQIAQEEARRVSYLEDQGERVKIIDHNLGVSRGGSTRARAVESGQPAGAVLWRATAGARSESDYGRAWFEGKDPDIVRFEAVNFIPSLESPESGFLWYGATIVTTRPLPAGSYQFFYNFRSYHEEICNRMTELERNTKDHRLTIRLPRRTLHEAFFDPVDIGSAVGADTSNGVLEPNAFSLDGATTTISSLKWEDGAVTMTLSPTASLADYAIDFIDVNGTTTLSLTSDNASTTPLAWTVPDKPWSDGDLLMLRIHKPISNDATLSGLALSGVDLTFDPATTTYAASVPATTTQTTVTPTLSHDSATYVVKLGGVVDDDGTIPLAAGDNVITIDVTAEDGSTTQTYTVTVTRATPSEPITVTLAPRVEGSETYVNLTIEWNDPQPCDGQYMVALYSSSDYLVTFMGFHPAPATTSLSSETYMWWDSRFFPDRWAGVSCDPSDYSGRRELGRVSLRAAHPDNN